MILTEQKTPTTPQGGPDLETLIRQKCRTGGCPNYTNPDYHHDMDWIKDHRNGGYWSVLVYCRYMTALRFDKEELREKGVI